ncbi:MAG: Polysaccharide biosynthesis protein [Candidatus Roizmanbacteria bacterium GW2011_GWA2_37_7]|uniref:Polysaccharide biosynthesis protein n=1 Tax=Candidatus Roizmanbacteria bacterium GW2011_GWA2_37_7 TaxID=1618481 RepID=A0A0G0H4I7_9BACT|nr:MAG: Polysaccharide biosynthesis protein [Candidatus Roizmanbacteria bacterium GW2011_GWA2_37_7]
MEKNQNSLKKNSIFSLMSLFFQSGYSAVLGLVANLILTIVLAPEIFGIYILTLSIISFLNYFSDIGLAASLVQKKDITSDDIRTTFTVQQILIVTLITIGFILTPYVRSFYDLPYEAIYLYWALLIAFFLSSLKTIPSIQLERHIQFQKIVFVQIVENTVFYISVSLLALNNMGLVSFVYAVLIRALTGTILIYSISFWMPKIGISRKSLKKLLSFGIPYQTNTLLALFKDDMIMLFLGKTLGLEALGYIGWAKRWAEAPIRIIMDNVSRILFPIFSRIQSEKERVAQLLEKIIRYQTMILAPTFVGMALLMNRFVELVPKYSKWEPALPIFYLILISAFLSSYSSPFINLFNALGKVKISFKFMVYWTAMSWILIPFLTSLYGIIGFPISLIILSLTFIVILFVAKKNITFAFIQQIYPGIVASTFMGLIVYIALYQPNSWIQFGFSIITGAVAYVLILYVVFKINIMKEVHSFFKYD